MVGDDATFRLVPRQASEMAGRVDALTLVLVGISAFFTLLILVLIVYFALKYRRRSEDEVPGPTRSIITLELTWIAVPLAIAMVIFFWGARLYTDMKRPLESDALEIHIVGRQWMWKAQHPGGQGEINSLHVPRGRAIKLTMTSQDVIHSFDIPAFRIKQDVVPGSYSTQWFRPSRTGEYRLFCAEYCGAGHSQMIGSVVVMEEDKYEAWLAGRTPDEPPEIAGAALFRSLGCAQCHGQTAPTLAGLFGREVTLEDGTKTIADDQYVRESILNPPARVVAGYPRLMPSYAGQLSPEQLNALLLYIRSLGAARADAAATSPRTGVAAPASRPATGFPPDRIQNLPPAQERSNFPNPPLER